MSEIEQELKVLLHKWQKAVTSGNVNELAELYTADTVFYDMKMPHLQKGPEAYVSMWQECLNMFELPTRHEVKDMTFVTGEDVAFAYGFARFGGKLKNGPDVDSWIRVSIGYRKENGQWKIAHEHVSVPLNMETMQPAMDLQP